MTSSPDATPARVAAIVLNWNGFADTCDAVESLLAQDWPALEVHVVDNASRGEEGARLAQRFGGRVVVRRNTTNLGFATAHNEVLANLLTDSAIHYVALLNNDAVAAHDWITQLVSAAEARPEVGACASLMAFKEQPEVVENAGGLLLRSGEAIPRGRGRPVAEFGHPVEVLAVCGGAALFRSEALRQIGVFRDEFFLNFEDVDLSLRLNAVGWRCLYVPQARVLHGLSRSIDKVRDVEFAVRSIRNMGFAYLANMPWQVLLLASPWLLVSWLAAPFACILALQFEYARVLTLGRLKLLRGAGALLAARSDLRRKRRGSWWRTWRLHGSTGRAYARFLRDVALLRRRQAFR